jgi:hypothetical protein
MLRKRSSIITHSSSIPHRMRLKSLIFDSNWPLDKNLDQGSKTQAIVFGLGSMFNHAKDPNVGWTRDIERQFVVYKALRDIKADEELCKCVLGSEPLKYTLMRTRYIVW